MSNVGVNCKALGVGIGIDKKSGAKEPVLIVGADVQGTIVPVANFGFDNAADFKRVITELEELATKCWPAETEQAEAE